MSSTTTDIQKETTPEGAQDSMTEPQATDAREVIEGNESKVTSDVETPEEAGMDEEKGQFSELRKGMAAWQWTVFHLVVFFGAAISGYDVSNVATVQVPIYEQFGHIDLLPWIATAFSLGNAATSPLLDQIMKLVDIKWFMLGNWILFLVATAVTGASPTIEGVIVGRTILGVSGGGIYLVILTYINLLAAPAEHSRVIGLLGMGFAVGLIGGPLIGGAFAANHHATWRWAFYICLPYGAIVMALAYAVCPPARLRPRESIAAGLLKIDWLGAFLHITVLVLFDAACIFSGGTLEWRSGAIALWVVCGVAAILFAIQQRFSLLTEPAQRILPVDVLSTRTGFLVMLCTLWATCGYGVALYYLPLFFAFTRGDDSLQTAVHMLPYICVYIAGAIGSGMILPMVRRYAAIYLVGGLLITVGTGAMQSVNPHTSLSQSMGLSTILGFGVGLTMQLGASVLALALPRNLRMNGAITMTLTVYTGTTVALALAGCIHQNIGIDYLSEALRAENLSRYQIRAALAGVASPLWASLGTQTLAAAVAAVTRSIISMFYLSTAGGALMVLCSLLMKWEALDFGKAAKKKGKKQEKMEQEVERAQ